MNQLVLLGILLVAGGAILAVVKGKKETAGATYYNYTKIKNLMTPAERSFFGVLQQAVGNDYQIFSKVRLADIVSPEKDLSRGNRQKAFNKIAAKHIDFVLCRKDNLEIECAIELNDKSHNERSREIRDELVEGICLSAKIPFLKVPAKTAYQIDEIRNLLSMNKNNTATLSTNS